MIGRENTENGGSEVAPVISRENTAVFSRPITGATSDPPFSKAETGFKETFSQHFLENGISATLDCSPRQRMPSTEERRVQNASMTWRAMSAPPCRRLIFEFRLVTIVGYHWPRCFFTAHPHSIPIVIVTGVRSDPPGWRLHTHMHSSFVHPSTCLCRARTSTRAPRAFPRAVFAQLTWRRPLWGLCLCPPCGGGVAARRATRHPLEHPARRGVHSSISQLNLSRSIH